MTEQEQRFILSICIMAAFADGSDAREGEEIRRIAQRLGDASGLDLAALHQDVLERRVALADAVRGLASAEAKTLAYEMAVCVCAADGVQSPDERIFLANLHAALGLDPASGRVHLERAAALAGIPLTTDDPAVPAGAVVAAVSTLSAAEMDQTILDAALLNGALELLPESLSTMAIIPLQMRLVYRIGKSYGYELDAGHLKDFLATAGVGLASQYLEQAGRKLLGGLLGAIGGGLLGGLGRQAASSGMSFASTYALGRVAQRYYAGGRVLSAPMLREAFEQMRADARALQERHLPQMQARARTLDVAKIVESVRGG